MTFPVRSSVRVPRILAVAGCILAVLMLATPERAGTQSLNGTTGLITIPTAEMLNDGQIRFGANYTDRKYNPRSPEHNQHRYFVTMEYLPFLEVSLRLTRNRGMRLENPEGQEWPGDRGASARLRILREKGVRPALVLGAHDFLSAFGGSEAVWFNALYLAGSKNLRCGEGPITLGLTLGYGTDRMKANHHEFAGLFGGLSMEYKDRSALLLEYDAEKINGGVRVELFRHVRIMLAFLHMESPCGGASYAFSL